MCVLKTQNLKHTVYNAFAATFEVTGHYWQSQRNSQSQIITILCGVVSTV